MRRDRPWWLPGVSIFHHVPYGALEDEREEPTSEPAAEPPADEVVLVHDPATNAPRAVYRRFIRD